MPRNTHLHLPEREEIATIVVCEDDDATLDLLCDHLVADRFDALPAPSAADALRLCRHNHPDLLLLDLALPDASALDLLREIRDSNGVDARFDPHLPIIVLTGRGGATDRVRGLELGADDYLQKPFAYPELRARIAAVLRRGHSRREGPMRVGEILIDPSRRKVTVGDQEVHLAKKEFTLLRVLASDPTRVFSKDELLRDVWGLRPPAARARTLDSHASRLRRRLDPRYGRYVVNCWGVGYRLLGTDEPGREGADPDAGGLSLRRDAREALADLRGDGLIDAVGERRLLRAARALADLQESGSVTAEQIAAASDFYVSSSRPRRSSVPAGSASSDPRTPARASRTSRCPRPVGPEEKGTP